MKISVIMAVYNGKKYLEEQLKSINLQSMNVDELIIIDDASLMPCDNIIEKFKETTMINVRYFKNSQNKGYAQTFFEALKLADGDYIFLSDQDDIWHNDKVETSISILSSHKEIRCLSARNVIVDDNGIYVKKEKALECDIVRVEIAPLIKQVLIRPGMSIVLTKSLKNEIEEYDTRLFETHDRFIEFIACIGGGFYICNQYLTDYRIHGNNTSGMNLSHTKLRTDRRGRIRQIDKERNYLQGIQKCGVKLDSEVLKTIEIYDKYYRKRRKMLEQGAFRYIFGSISILYGYCNPKIWLGDIYSMIQEKRFI